jgi:tripartite-type tricarboxylate transporter receptor subunit TctC
MKFARRHFLHLAAGAAALPAISRIAGAQSRSTRPITIIVPYAPGGAGDLAVRVLSEPLAATLGQNVIIENVSGGSALIGTGRVARARQTDTRSSVTIWRLPQMYRYSPKRPSMSRKI